MRPIISYTLSQELGYILDLADVPRAVIVYPSSGDAILNEGPGGVLDGVAVEGKSISAFWTDRVNGELVLGLSFQRGAVTERHVLGAVNDLRSAEAWVERVNGLYVERARREEEVADKREGQFKTYPVVHDILTTKSNLILPGDYLRSTEGFPPSVYKPAWQTHYVKCALRHLQEITGVPTEDVQENWLIPPEHRYPYLADRIKYGARDFEYRVTQPLEFMFERGPRVDKIGIIPLAEATDFAAVYLRGTPVENAMNLRDGERSYISFEAWLQAFSESLGPSGRKFLMCTPADTSVDYLMNDMIMKEKVRFIGLKASMPSVSTLADWLVKFQGIVACDVGIAYQIKHYIRQETGTGFGVGFSLVPYDIPVPVGEAYRVDDPLWGEICRLSISDCFQSQDDNILASLADTEERVAKLGMKWLVAA